MNEFPLFWLAPALPLLVFVVLALGLIRRGWLAKWLAVAALAGSSTVAASSLVAAAHGTQSQVSLPWLTVGGRELRLALALDPLGALVATLVSVVGMLVFIYAAYYMAADPRLVRFFAIFSLFAAAMLTLVLAADLLTLFIAWELVGLCSYFLIGFWFERPGVPGAATKAFLTTRVSDQALLAGILLLVGAVGSGRIDEVLAAVSAGRVAPRLLLVAALLLFAGAAGKSAQVPFGGWLPDAMAGPTPVSALLHSATMVTAGVFLVARLYPLFQAAEPMLSVVAWVGAITALLGATVALVQTDLKRTLAYSTMSQLGLMFVGLGSGSLLAGILLLFAQALYKAPLFLAAGAVDHAVHGTAFERMGGLARRMPYTWFVFMIAAAALAGLPVTFALPPKDPVLMAAWEAQSALFAVVLLASLGTALYSGRMLGLVFFGNASEEATHAHEAPTGFLAPMLAFVVLLVLGLLADAAIVNRPLAELFHDEAPESVGVTALAIGIAVLGAALGLAARRTWPNSVIWPILRPLIPLLTAEFGLAPLYRGVQHFGLGFANRLSMFDQRVFDPVGIWTARATERATASFGNVDRHIFDPAPRRMAHAARTMIRAAARFDRHVFDAGATWSADATRRLILASARFDLRRIDAVFNAFGHWLLAVSQRFRHFQTGRIENYLLAVFIWGLGAFVLAVIATAIR